MQSNGHAGCEELGDRGPPEGGAVTVVVGYAFMSKKMESMAEVVAVGPVDGVEFVPLEFSRRPQEHRHVDAILHKLSEDIMFRDVRQEGDVRLSWIETYLAGNPGTVILDPIDKVASCINRVTTLELLEEAYRKHGSEGGMPRPPRYVVLEKNQPPRNGKFGTVPGGVAGTGIVRGSGLKFPVICKPVEACGTRGSHDMVVVLDEDGLASLTPPLVVQECRNHGAKLFKVCVVGEEVRVHERPSLPDLPEGLAGSFAFDSQRPYPTLAQVKAVTTAVATSSLVPPDPRPPPPPALPTERGRSFAGRTTSGEGFDPHSERTFAGCSSSEARGAEDGSRQTCRLPAAAEAASRPMAETGAESTGVQGAGIVVARAGGQVGGAGAGAAAAAAGAGAAGAGAERGEGAGASRNADAVAAVAAVAAAAAANPPALSPVTVAGAAPGARGAPCSYPQQPEVTLEAARKAAARMRETFGLSLFGFDLIIDAGPAREALVIDVNYFPSFKDLRDFPQVLRRRLKEVVSSAKALNCGQARAQADLPRTEK